MLCLPGTSLAPGPWDTPPCWNLADTIIFFSGFFSSFSQRVNPHQTLPHRPPLGPGKGRSNPSPFQLRRSKGRGALIYVPLTSCCQTSLQITVKDPADTEILQKARLL